VSASIVADVSKVLTGHITAQEGFPVTVSVAYNKPYLTGNIAISETRKLFTGGSIGVKVTILIFDIERTFKKDWDLVPPYSRPLQSWQLFNVNL